MSDFATLIANDFSEVMDGLEPITINLLNRATTESVNIPNAHRYQMNRALAKYWDVSIQDDSFQFSFQAADFVPISNPANILATDTITDADGHVYNVTNTRVSVLATVFDVLVKRIPGT